MNVAVLSLTRDRLDYTKASFASLHKNAGCRWDHYVLDNGSTDGTAEWLHLEYDKLFAVQSPDNIGIAAGMNLLLDRLVGDYDVIVKFDNDCLLTQPNTLRNICRLVLKSGSAILSPRILGLNNPPQPTRELRIGDEVILDIPQIGGIFLAAPGWVYDEYRYPADDLPKWGGDDAHICAWWRQQGGTCGYVKRLEAWHIDSTQGQQEKYPGYFKRKFAEMAS